MLHGFIAWVDQAFTDDDAVLRARNRSQHAVAFLTGLVGLPYAVLLTSGGNVLAGMLALSTAVTSVLALYGCTRRGAHWIGGVIISTSMLLAISVVLVSRGGLHSNSSIWLMLTPVIGAMTAGPRVGLAIGGAVSVLTLGLWSAQSMGLELSSNLDPDIAWWLVAVDHAVVPLSLALVLSAQHTVWTGVVKRLDTTNDALRKEVAERERAERAAQAAAEARTTFLATMSHEIRTPLNGVLGVADVMLDGPLSPGQRELASTVRRSGEILRTVLDDVLDFSKIDTGKLTLEEAPTQLERTFRELQSLWRPRAQEQGTRLEIEIDDSLPDWVYLDDNRLRQVIGNLLSNAIKFTRAGRVTLGADAREDRICVWVSDTGVGIDAKALDRIFEPFDQLDSSDQRRFGGTGLGLAISRQLVSLMGGQLEVSSEQGVGSRFSFSLAMVEAAAPVQLFTTAASREALAGRRVLVAEDNLINQKVLSAMLARSEVSLRIASDGLECIAMCAEEQPEIILMDCQMPRCDGYEATRRLREAGVEVPIIAVTASTMPGDRQRSLEAGMNAHLTKPIKVAELDEVLMHWLARVA